MNQIPLNELSEETRRLLIDAEQAGEVVVEEDAAPATVNGHLSCSFGLNSSTKARIILIRHGARSS